jgi:MFS family permease
MRRNLVLLALQHALIHAQGALLPLVFVRVVTEFGVGVDAIGLVLGAANLVNGVLQLSFGPLARSITRRTILGGAGVVFGAGTAALAAATSWPVFAAATVVARAGGAPQHVVGHALLADGYGPRRGAMAINLHVAAGNVGTVLVPLIGGWLIASAGWPVAVLAVGLPGLAVGVAILRFVEGPGTGHAALAGSSTRDVLRSLTGERDVVWVTVASSIAAAGRGLGIVTTFVPLYLGLVLGLDPATIALMYTLLVAGSVPGPVVGGWLAGRLGHRPVVIASYVLGAAAFGSFVLAGSNLLFVWLALGFMSAVVFEESALLQALLAEVARPAIRDVAFGVYFTVMFVVGAAWSAVLGWLVGALGNEAGFPVAFGVMAASYLLAAVAVLPIREPSRHPEAAGHDEDRAAIAEPW